MRANLHSRGVPMSEQARTPSEPYEIRMATLDDGRKELDEVIAKCANVHFESMSENGLWCGITLPDGRELHVNIWAALGEVRWAVEEDWPGGKDYR